MATAGRAMLRRRSALAGVRMRRSGAVSAVQERVKRAVTSVMVVTFEGNDDDDGSSESDRVP